MIQTYLGKLEEAIDITTVMSKSSKLEDAEIPLSAETFTVFLMVTMI